MSELPEGHAGWCVICGKSFPAEQLTNAHACSYECLGCAEETERILHDDEWWRVNGPTEEED